MFHSIDLFLRLLPLASNADVRSVTSAKESTLITPPAPRLILLSLLSPNFQGIWVPWFGHMFAFGADPVKFFTEQADKVIVRNVCFLPHAPGRRSCLIYPFQQGLRSYDWK